MIYHREFRLSIKWLKRASSKEIPCLNKFYKIYNKHSIHFSSPQKAHAFRGPRNQINLFVSLAKGAGLRWRPLHKVQKHRPNRQERRWVQLVALGGIMKKSLDIESKLFLALFVFCSRAVPSYSSHSQNTKFISLYPKSASV